MAGFMATNASMTICIFPKAMPLNIDDLRKSAFCDAVDPDGFRSGFVGLGEILDTDNFFLASADPVYSGFSYRLDSRKPAKAVINLQLQEKIRAEEAAGRPVGAKRKKELREAIVEALVSQSEFVPALTDCIWDSQKGRLFIAATSESLIERILKAFCGLLGQECHLLEPDRDMREVFAQIQKNNGCSANGYSVQPLGSAQLVAENENGEKSVILAQNNEDAVREGMNQGLAISKISLTASKPDSEEELVFTLADDLKISRIQLPRAEKGADEDATFMINANYCAAVADIVEELARAAS